MNLQEIFNAASVKKILLAAVVVLFGGAILSFLSGTVAAAFLAGSGTAAYLAIASLSVAGFLFVDTHKRTGEISDLRKYGSLVITGAWILGALAEALFLEAGALSWVMIPLSIVFGFSDLVRQVVNGISRSFKAAVIMQLGVSNQGDFGAEMAKRVHEVFADDKDNLLRGDTMRASLERHPFEKYPTLYQTIRPDMRRPVHHDGYLVTGERMSKLAYMLVDEKSAIKLHNARLKVISSRFASVILVGAMVAASAGLMLNSGASKLSGFMSKPAAVEAKMAMPAQRSNDIMTATAVRDVWSREDAAEALKEGEKAKPSAWFQTGLASTLGFLMPILGPVLSLVIAASLLLFFAFRSALNPSKIKGGLDAIVNSDKALLMKTSRSESIYQHDLSTNALEYRAYCDAVKETWEDGTPFIPLLIGTNTVLSRGFKNSWSTDQVVGLTLNNLRQHLMVVGGTGSGKSFAILTPLMRQAMLHGAPDYVVKNGEYIARPYDLSVIVTDGGGTLQAEGVRLARELGWQLRSVGLRQNDVGMDLHDGVDPGQLAEVYAQVDEIIGSGKAKADGSWYDGGCKIRSAVLNVARAAEVTAWGRKYVIENGEKLNSPLGAYKLFACAGMKTGFLMDAINAINDTLLSPDLDERAKVAPYVNATLMAQMEFLTSESGIFKLPEKQLAGQMDTMMPLFSLFYSTPTMIRRFGSGSEAFPVDSLWDDRTVTVINANTAIDGSAALAVTVFVTARITARKTELSIIDPKVGEKKISLFFSDENQEQVASGTSQFALQNFANRARKTGLCLICATQGVNALYKAFGETTSGPQTKNYLQNFRSKLFLAGDDPETLDELESLSSTISRYYTAPGVSESYYSAKAALGSDGSDDVTAIELSDAAAERLAMDSSRSIEARQVELVEADMQYAGAEFKTLGMSQNGSQSHSYDVVEKVKSVMWRKEDREHTLLTTGREKEPLVSRHDVIAGGRTFATASFLAGGQIKIGIVKTCPDLGFAPGVFESTNFSKSAVPAEVIEAADSRSSAAYKDLVEKMRTPKPQPGSAAHQIDETLVIEEA